MRLRVPLRAGFAALVAAVLSLGLALPASAVTPSVHDETGLLTVRQVPELEQVLAATGQKYGVHLSVTLLKRLPAGQSLKAAAKLAAGRVGLVAGERSTQIAFLYVRHGAQAYTVLGSKAAGRIKQSLTDDIWRNQIHARFHVQQYYQGLRKGMTLMAASYVGLSNAAYTQPMPTSAQLALQHEHGWFGVRIALGLATAVAASSFTLAWLGFRKRRVAKA